MRNEKLTKKAMLTAATAVVFGGALNMASPFLPVFAEEGGMAEAQSIDGGGQARMNASGMLTVLGQTVAAAACMLDAGFDIEHERELLDEAHHEFNHALFALEHGNIHVGIPTAEHYSSAIKAIREVHAIWEPMNESVEKMLEGDHPHEHAMLIAQNNVALLEATELLNSIIISEYANPFDVVLNDALAISFAERQEMFAEKLKREACEIGGGHANAEILEDFDATIAMFGNTLTALHDGYPAAGIAPPPNEAIKHHLEQAMDEWVEAVPMLVSVREKGGATEEEMVAIRKATEHLDERMHGVVIEYLLSTPGATDMLEGPLTDYAEGVLMPWVTDPIIIDAIKAHNAETANYSLEKIEELDAIWMAELDAGGGDMIYGMEHHPASEFLKGIKGSTSGIITEAFIMDIRGMNVAESEPTAHYYHGQQARWRNIMEHTGTKMYISDVHVEEDTENYQSQVSLPITDPETNQIIGVATFGVNVQNMF